MLIKILKILSLLLLPIILIALAIRFFLHVKFDRRCFYIPVNVTKQEELVLAKNPELVKKAALEVSPAFFALPKKYQIMTIKSPEGQTPEITFSINITKLGQDLLSAKIPFLNIDLDSLKWPKKDLDKHFDFAYDRQFSSTEETLINRVRMMEKENGDKEWMCFESKELLARYFVKRLFQPSDLQHASSPELNKITFLPFGNENQETIWGPPLL